MNYLDLLKTGKLNLPIDYSMDIPFIEFVKITFSEYIALLNTIDEGSLVGKLKKQIPSIQKLCDCIVESFEKLYMGFPNQSYGIFFEGMKAIEPVVLKHVITHPLSESGLFFRARYSENPLSLKEMFHVPFQERERATTQRFSIPGFPCLYLGSSSYACWEELNRPSFDSFYVSRFEIDWLNSSPTLLITLDISQTPQKMMKMIDTTLEVVQSVDKWDDYVIEYLVKWPLIFSSTIKVRYSDRSFKPEYVIPQYLLIWARENGRIGAIKYFSVKTHLNQNIDSSSFWNVVIPVRVIRNEGFCSALLTAFKLTEPIRVSDIDETTTAVQADVENYILMFHPETSVLLHSLKDFTTKYTDSKFGRTDIYLCKQQTHTLG